MFDKKKILLTGGNGFIGKNIKESFLSEKYEIIAPSSFELNLIDTKSVDNYFVDKSFDVVLHAAAKPGHRNAKDLTNLFFSNVTMFENLERQKSKFKKLLNFGSGAIYDVSCDIENITESAIFKRMPLDEHGFCKYVEQKQIDNLDNFVSLNIFGIYGKYEDWQIRFISNAICKTLFGLPITLKQNRRFSYLFIDDLMSVLEFFIEHDVAKKAYNIVPDESIELLTLAQIVKDISGKDIEILVEKNGFGLEYSASNRLLKEAFGDVRFSNVNDSIKRLYNYYSENIDKLDKKLLLNDL